MGVVICSLCKKMTAETRYGVCLHHVQGKADPPEPGICDACGDYAFRTWVTPNDGRRWCGTHLRELVRRAMLGGQTTMNPDG
jgi:hypothetical protein